MQRRLLALQFKSLILMESCSKVKEEKPSLEKPAEKAQTGRGTHGIFKKQTANVLPLAVSESGVSPGSADPKCGGSPPRVGGPPLLQACKVRSLCLTRFQLSSKIIWRSL